MGSMFHERPTSFAEEKIQNQKNNPLSIELYIIRSTS